MRNRLLGNRYEIMDQIGGGGMSLVYRAKDVYLDRIVAIKILREQYTGDEEFIARFRREAQSVASLSHDNIVSIYDVGQEENTYYLVMEMVDGKNLREVIRERGPLPVKEVIEIASQICDALEHAHDHKIIHRDIKPHNIILTETGKAKVTDFGIARAVSTATVTHTGSIMGSVHYFSPEQAKGEIADEKSDIYSLGVVLYEMLTGHLPFQGETPISVVMKKINSDPLPPSRYNHEIGDTLEKVILRAMDRDPAKRYEHVFQLKQDLHSAYLYNKLEYQLPNAITEDTINLKSLTMRRKKDDLAVPVRVWTWVMITLIVIGFILGMYLSATVIARGEVKVPNIVGLSSETAEETLASAGLTMEVEKTMNHPALAQGLIISQQPKADQVVKKNVKITVTVSNGPAMVKVPAVLNSSLLSAEVTLTNAGLVLGETTRVYNSQIPAGQVIHQEPRADDQAVQGTPVNLIISRGPEPLWLKMPMLAGNTLTQAKAALQNYNLVLGVVQAEKSDKFAKDMVIRQDPGADSEVLQGSTVNLVVSEGPGPLNEEAIVRFTMTYNAMVKIVLQDSRGRNVVYEHQHYTGETIEKSVTHFGNGTVEVYLNDKLLLRQDV